MKKGKSYDKKIFHMILNYVTAKYNPRKIFQNLSSTK